MHSNNFNTDNSVTKIRKADFLRLPAHMRNIADGPRVLKNVGGGKMEFALVEII